MVYLLKMVIFHGKLLNNQMVSGDDLTNKKVMFSPPNRRSSWPQEVGFNQPNAGIKQKTIEFSQQKLVNDGFMVICHGTWT